MSAIEEARAAAPQKAKKEYRDIYSGPATVREVTPFAPQFTDGLTEEEAAAAFDVQLLVEPDDAGVGEQRITLPVSARRPRFNPAKTEAELSTEALAAQGLCEAGDVAGVLSAAGKRCRIDVFTETSEKGTFTRCRLSRQRARLGADDVARRIAAMTGRAPAAPARPAAPAPDANPFG